MSEKRFEFYSDEDLVGVLDIVTGRTFNSFEIVDVLNEQQATIEQLQDLCGESDSENAKLRIENKRLQEEIKLLKPTNMEQYEQIVQLQQENEQLRKELDNFKPVIFQDMQNGTVILYFKGDD